MFWGILSLLQILFLPGFIVLKYFQNKQMGFLERITFSFALSLIINFLIVFILTSLGLYQRLLVLLIFLGELVLVFWLYRSSILAGIDSFAKPVLQWLHKFLRFLDRAKTENGTGMAEVVENGALCRLVVGGNLNSSLDIQNSF